MTMKKILILLLLFPLAGFSKKKVYANPCDSMQNIVEAPNRTLAELRTAAQNVLNGIAVEKNESINSQSINDSTIIITGIFEMHKAPSAINPIYGPYTIYSYADGYISWTMILNFRPGKFRYEFTNLKHFGCRMPRGELCINGENDFLSRGLKIKFLERMENILYTLRALSVQAKNW